MERGPDVGGELRQRGMSRVEEPTVSRREPTFGLLRIMVPDTFFLFNPLGDKTVANITDGDEVFGL